MFCGRAEMNRAGWNAVQGTGQVGLIGLVSGRLRGECKAEPGGFALQVLHFTRTELFVDAGGFHSDCADQAGLQPVGEGDEVGCEGGIGAHR